MQYIMDKILNQAKYYYRKKCWKAFSHKLGTGKWVGGPWLTRGSWET